jgi:hypothetical protein
MNKEVCYWNDGNAQSMVDTMDAIVATQKVGLQYNIDAAIQFHIIPVIR